MKMRAHATVLITGASGLIGRAVIARLLEAHPSLRFVAMLRDPLGVRAWAHLRGHERIDVVCGDLRADGLGLNAAVRARLCADTEHILHLAADTTFSRPLGEARAVNSDGTARLLELAASCARAPRFVHVSTAFVAGRSTGTILEEPGRACAWVNGYEQSKAEAEALVVAYASDWVIVRPSTIVCDDTGGGMTQFNAAHRALRLYRDGLAAMMPGCDGSSVDTVTTDYVAAGLSRLAFDRDASGRVFHLCAGANALPLTDMLDMTFERWARDPLWRRRGIARPVLADLPTYALFERTVEETADPSLRRVIRALSHFVPQLALPKRFDTTNADSTLGFAAPSAVSYWPAMLDALLATNKWTDRRAA